MSFFFKLSAMCFLITIILGSLSLLISFKKGLGPLNFFLLFRNTLKLFDLENFIHISKKFLLTSDAMIQHFFLVIFL